MASGKRDRAGTDHRCRNRFQTWESLDILREYIVSLLLAAVENHPPAETIGFWGIPESEAMDYHKALGNHFAASIDWVSQPVKSGSFNNSKRGASCCSPHTGTSGTRNLRFDSGSAEKI